MDTARKADSKETNEQGTRAERSSTSRGPDREDKAEEVEPQPQGKPHEDEPKAKRARGRPKGSKGKKTLEKEAREAERMAGERENEAITIAEEAMDEGPGEGDNNPIQREEGEVEGWQQQDLEITDDWRHRFDTVMTTDPIVQLGGEERMSQEVKDKYD